MYNPLIDTAPSKWRGVKIKTDFRQVLRFFRLMNDKAFSDKEKALITIKIFFESVPEDNNEMWEFISFFINCGEDSKEDQDDDEKVFDFEVDSGRIYGAFKQVYKIDLKSEALHWWDFMHLFKCLPDNTMLKQVIDIRGKKLGKNDSKEYVNQIMKLKDIYKLSEEKKVDESKLMEKW